MSKSVIDCPFLRIAQDLVGLINLFEFGLGICFRIDVRMVLLSQLAEGPLERLLISAPFYAKHFVIVALFAHQAIPNL